MNIGYLKCIKSPKAMNPFNMKYLLFSLSFTVSCLRIEESTLISPVESTVDPCCQEFKWTAKQAGPYRLLVTRRTYPSEVVVDEMVNSTSYQMNTAMEPGTQWKWSVTMPDGTWDEANFGVRNVTKDMAGNFPVTIRYHTWGIAGPINFDTTYQGTFNLFNDNGVLWVTESTSNLNQDVYPVVQASDSLQMRYEMEQFSSLRFVYGKLYYHQDSIWFQFSQGGLAGGGIYEYRGKR